MKVAPFRVGQTVHSVRLQQVVIMGLCHLALGQHGLVPERARHFKNKHVPIAQLLGGSKPTVQLSTNHQVETAK